MAKKQEGLDKLSLSLILFLFAHVFAHFWSEKERLGSAGVMMWMWIRIHSSSLVGGMNEMGLCYAKMRGRENSEWGNRWRRRVDGNTPAEENYYKYTHRHTHTDDIRTTRSRTRVNENDQGNRQGK
ncbi:MAG: hypothetical protein JOS17DRAFT_614304 [Linnemannia elongata]|nr:MAG: hypothetical protein JOS17DRAFT_614304 [Linnemannia elongata]